MVNAEYPETRVSARDLYKKYVDFHWNYKYLMTETVFGRESKRIAGVIKKKTNSLYLFLMDHPTIKMYLEEINEYDPDAEY